MRLEVGLEHHRRRGGIDGSFAGATANTRGTQSALGDHGSEALVVCLDRDRPTRFGSQRLDLLQHSTRGRADVAGERQWEPDHDARGASFARVSQDRPMVGRSIAGPLDDGERGGHVSCGIRDGQADPARAQVHAQDPPQA